MASTMKLHTGPTSALECYRFVGDMDSLTDLSYIRQFLQLKNSI
jgi:hypothetical protein